MNFHLFRRIIAMLLVVCMLPLSSIPTFASPTDSGSNGSTQTTGGTGSNIDCWTKFGTGCKLSLIIQTAGTYASTEVFENNWPMPYKEQSIYLLPSGYSGNDNILFTYTGNTKGDFSIEKTPSAEAAFKATKDTAKNISSSGTYSRSDLANIIWNFWYPDITHGSTFLNSAGIESFFNNGASYTNISSFKSYASRIGLNPDLVEEASGGYASGIRLWPQYMTTAYYESTDSKVKSCLTANALAYCTIAAWYKAVDPNIDLEDVYNYVMCNGSEKEYLIMSEPMLCWKNNATGDIGFLSVLDAYRIAMDIPYNEPIISHSFVDSDYNSQAGKKNWKGWDRVNTWTEYSTKNTAQLIVARVWREKLNAVGHDAERMQYYVRDEGEGYHAISRYVTSFTSGEAVDDMIAGFGIIKAPPNITLKLPKASATHTLVASFPNSTGVNTEITDANAYNWDNPTQTKEATVNQSINGAATNIQLNITDDNAKKFGKQISDYLTEKHNAGSSDPSVSLYLQAVINKTGDDHVKAYVPSGNGNIKEGASGGSKYIYDTSKYPINNDLILSYDTETITEYDIEGANYYVASTSGDSDDDEYMISYVTAEYPNTTISFGATTESSNKSIYTSSSSISPIKDTTVRLEYTIQAERSGSLSITDVKFVGISDNYIGKLKMENGDNDYENVNVYYNNPGNLNSKETNNLVLADLIFKAVKANVTSSTGTIRYDMKSDRLMLFPGGGTLSNTYISTNAADKHGNVYPGFTITSGTPKIYPDQNKMITYTESSTNTDKTVAAWSSCKAWNNGYEDKYLIPMETKGRQSYTVYAATTEGGDANKSFINKNTGAASSETLTIRYSQLDNIEQIIKNLNGQFVTLAPISASDAKYTEPGSYIHNYISTAKLVVDDTDLALDLGSSSSQLTVNITQSALNVSWHNQPLAFAEVKQGTYSKDRSTETYDAMTGVPTTINDQPTSFYANFGGTPFYVNVSAHLSEGHIEQTYRMNGTYTKYQHISVKVAGEKKHNIVKVNIPIAETLYHIDSGKFYYWTLDSVQLIPVETWQINGNVLQNRDSSTATFAESENSPAKYLNIWANEGQPAGVDASTGTITFNLNPSGGTSSDGVNIDSSYGANKINSTLTVAGSTVKLTGSHYKEGYSYDATTGAYGIIGRSDFNFRGSTTYTNEASLLSTLYDQFKDDTYFVNFDTLKLTFTKDGVTETYNILTSPTGNPSISGRLFKSPGGISEHTGYCTRDYCSGLKSDVHYYTSRGINTTTDPVTRLGTTLSTSVVKGNWHPSATDGSNDPIWSESHAMPVIGYQGVPDSVNRNNYIIRTSNGQPKYLTNSTPNGVPTGGPEITNTIISGIKIKSNWKQNANDVHITPNATWTIPYAYDDEGNYSLPNGRYDFIYNRQYPASVGPKDSFGNIIPWYQETEDPDAVTNPQWFNGYLEDQYTSSAFLSSTVKVDLYDDDYHGEYKPEDKMYLEYIDPTNAHNEGQWKKVSDHVTDSWGTYSYNWCGINPIIIYNPVAAVGLKLTESKRPDMRILGNDSSTGVTAENRRKTIPALNIDDTFSLVFSSAMDCGILNNTSTNTKGGLTFSQMYNTTFGATAHTVAGRGSTDAKGNSLKPASYSQAGDIYGAVGKGYSTKVTKSEGTYPVAFNNQLYTPSNVRTDNSIWANDAAGNYYTNKYIKRYWVYIPVDTVYNGASSGINAGPFTNTGTAVSGNLLKGGYWYYFTPGTEPDVVMNMAISPTANDTAAAMYLVVAEATNSNQTALDFVNKVIANGYVQFESASTIKDYVGKYNDLLKPVNGSVSPLQNSTNLRRAGGNTAAHFASNSIMADIIGSIGNPMIDYVEDPDFSTTYSKSDVYSTVTNDIFGDASKSVNQTNGMGIYHKTHSAGNNLPISASNGNTMDLGYGFNFSIQTIGSLIQNSTITVTPSYFYSAAGNTSYKPVKTITYANTNSTQAKIYSKAGGEVVQYPLDINLGKSTTKINTPSEGSGDRTGNETQRDGDSVISARSLGVDKGVRVGTPQSISLQKYTKLFNGSTQISKGDGSVSVAIKNPTDSDINLANKNHQRWLGSFTLPSSSKFYTDSTTAETPNANSTLLIKFDFQTSNVNWIAPENTSTAGVTTAQTPSWSFRYSVATGAGVGGVNYTKTVVTNPPAPENPSGSDDPTTPMAIINVGRTSADDMSNVGTH